MRWTLDFSGGYDDQALSDPDRFGVLEPVGQGFYRAGTQVDLDWTFSRRNRVELAAQAAMTDFGTDVTGDDTDLRAVASLHHRLGARFALDATAAGWHFRRQSRDVYDMDLALGGARLTWSPSGRWLLTGGLSHHWTQYPGRPIDPDSVLSEAHRLMDVVLGAAYRFGSTLLSSNVILRRNQANAEAARYEGPVFTLRSRTVLPPGVGVSLSVVHSRRVYDALATWTASPDGLVPAAAILREDKAWEFGLGIERPVTPRLRVFADAVYYDQNSSESVYSFHQTRVSAGFSVDLVSPPPLRPSLSLPQAALRPVTTATGVHFRLKAPAATRVSLVGSFNGWAEGVHLLRGPGRDGVWEVRIPLEPGLWRYAFVVDGEWVKPQDAPWYEEDGYGGENGVIEVQGGQEP